MVDYALGHTGNVHYDAPTSDRNPEDKDWEQMQLLVKEGDDVGLIFCCPSLKRNLHLRAKKGFAVIMSECILELLGHCAAAASQSRTPVFNGRVPFTQHSLLGTFVRDVFACQAAQNIPATCCRLQLRQTMLIQLLHQLATLVTLEPGPVGCAQTGGVQNEGPTGIQIWPVMQRGHFGPRTFE
jgi:hypothetical protein